MARDEELTSLEELLSHSSGRAPQPPARPGLFICCVAVMVVALAWLSRVIYLFFPLPWDFLMWLSGR